jgi:glutamine amidotransferase-like uncharacterized protein
MDTSILLRRRTQVIAGVIILVLISTSIVVFYPREKPLVSIRVSVFADLGVQTQSKVSVQHMFEWMGAEVTIINKTSILDGVLDSTDFLVMPGGCWCNVHCSIDGENEMSLVRQYVLDGGAYFGIDGGASYATSWRTGLLNGTLYPDVFGARFNFTDIEINRDSEGPNLSGAKSTYTLFYENSGYFIAENATGVIPIAYYKDTDCCCMLAFEAGAGRVFLSSPHPEYEEGSLNDGTDYFDTMNDPDSEWPLMLSIALWLLRL